ncbi:MAG: hypothetical protein ABI193_09725 [Minicystis sp.]
MLRDDVLRVSAHVRKKDTATGELVRSPAPAASEAGAPAPVITPPGDPTPGSGP